jgi:oligosaccharide repeat unit polymerase
MLILSLLISLYASYKSEESIFLFWISISAVLFMLAINSDLGLYSGYLMIFIFMFVFYSFIISNLYAFKHIPKEIDLRIRDKPLLFIAITCTLFAIVTYVIGAGGLDGIKRTWIDIATNRTTIELIISNFSQLFYIFSISCFLLLYKSNRKVSNILWIVVLALVFLSLTRAKAYLLPVVIPFLFFYINDNKKNPVKLIIRLLLFIVLALTLYTFTTVIRWAGSIDQWSVDHLYQIFQNVMDAGVERNLNIQTSIIFEYYMDNPYLYGQTYATFFNPLLKLFNLSFDNPMYIYSEIIYGKSHSMRGSAHPTIFVDSFANFGVLGCLVGGGWILCLKYLGAFYSKYSKLHRMVLLVASSYSIPLAVRGSVYYGFLYLTMSLFFSAIMILLLHKFIFKRKNND